MWTAFICLDEMLVVELPPSEDITPVAEVIRTVRKTVPENKDHKNKLLIIGNIHVHKVISS